MNKLTDRLFWIVFTNTFTLELPKFQNLIQYILLEFGTKQPCNRFDIGNSIEFELADIIKKCDLDVKELPNAKRIDICVNEHYKLSIKYSSTGNIKLHNSNNSSNKDMTMTDLLLLTSDNLYLITNDNINDLDIDITNYLQNTGDGLSLKRTILTELKKKNFEYMMPIDLNIDKSQCKNRLCSKLFLQQVKSEFANQIEDDF